jgi:hypothetical protein
MVTYLGVTYNLFLLVFEPDGGKSYYGNNCTHLGGWSSPDYSGCTAYSTSMLRVITVN